MITDDNGYVAFPTRVIKANLSSIIFGSLRNFLGHGIHAGFGTNAYLIARGKEGLQTGGTEYLPYLPLPKQIVMKRQN